MPDTCLILFAHGSRDPKWRRPFERLRAELAANLGEDRVRLAYMEFAEPTLSRVAEEAVRGGARRIRLLPLFMAAGGHVDRDIPDQVEAVRKTHPELSVEVLPPVGEDPRLMAVLREIGEGALADAAPGERTP